MKNHHISYFSANIRRFLSAAALLATFWLLPACSAHYPINIPVESVQSLDKFSLKNIKGEKDDDTIILALSFSGGGTRAAAYAYGILEALAETRIEVNGNHRRLLDSVDVISSVSGGSFPAAYYGLFGDRVFSDFEGKFLKYDVQTELKNRIMSPLNWSRLGSLYFTRSDLAAEYYDELLFEGKTFEDFQTLNGPMIIINATDIAVGAQFSFAGMWFAPICTDLPAYPVSRAVTASSAVPGVFTSIIIKNHAGACDYRLPGWATDALNNRMDDPRRYQLAKYLDAYQHTENYTYLHLLDGGISDNLGIRPIINAVTMSGGAWEKLRQLQLTHTSKLVVIAVNAQNREEVTFSKKDYSVPLIDAIGASSSVPLNQYSFETMEILRHTMAAWEKDVSAIRCQDNKSSPGITSNCAVDTYLVEVSFEAMEDAVERKHLENLPTTFHLEPDDVDRLKAAAKKTLRASPVFQKLLSDLQ